MRVLLDECVPWPMHKLLVGHECTSTQWRGWTGFKNGELIRLAEQEFDLFITSDQNLRYQQNLAGRCLAVLELSTNDLRRILAASGDIVAAVATLIGVPRSRIFRKKVAPWHFSETFHQNDAILCLL